MQQDKKGIYKIAKVLLVSVLLCIPTKNVFAQTTDQREDLLPDIDPQDIEIRADFRAQFQGLTRQPILGFKPEPRVFQIDPDRLPFIEDEEDVVATVSLSDLEEPLSPETQLIGFPDEGRAFLSAGYGLMNTPLGRIFIEQEIGPSTSIRADGRFTSSDGHGLDHPTSFRSLNFDTDLSYRANGGRVRAGLTGYSYYNYTGDATHVVYDADEPPRNESNMLEANIDWIRLNNPYNGWDIQGKIRNTEVGIDRFNYYIDGDLEFDERIFNEQLLSVHVHRFFEGPEIEEQFLIEGGVEAGFFNNGVQNQNWNYGWFGFNYVRRFAQVHRFKAGVKAFQTYDPLDDLNFRFYPDARYSYNPGTGFQLDVYAFGNVENEGLNMIPQTNRMTVNVPILRNKRGWNLGSQASYSWPKGSKLYANVSYESYDGYPFFRYTGHLSGHQLDFANSVSILEATAGFATDIIPRKLSFRTELTARSTSMNGDEQVPYKEPVAAMAELYSNPISNVYLQGSLDIRTGRPTLNSERLAGFVLAGLRAEYKISSGIGIYLKGQNLLNQNYELWQGYQERPIQVLGGITLRM